MKKIISFVLALSLLMSFSACSNEPKNIPEEQQIVPEVSEPEEIPEEPEEKVYEYVPAKAIDYFELQEEINAERKATIETEGAFEGFKDYLVEDPSARGIITKEEIRELKTEKRIKETITAEEAKEDVDLFFRALKYGYGAYYYFGGNEAFDKAKEEVMSFIEEKKRISSYDLGNKIRDSLDFVRDGHFGVYGNSPVNVDGGRFEFYYCEGQEFSKDENGFYKETVNGEKWYFSGSENPDISIKPYLNSEGWIVYAPVLFSRGKSKKDEIKLTLGEETRTEEIFWKEAKEYNPGGLDFNYIEENEMAFLSIRSFGRQEYDFGPFLNSGKEASDEEFLIFDIRSNEGGGGYENEWIGFFSGTTGEIKRIHGERITGFSHETMRDYGNERYGLGKDEGVFIENEIPVIVLVDDYCGSAGESMLLGLKTLENALVIGSNSIGAQVCGSSKSLWFPNSGIDFYMGTNLGFHNTMELVDGKGYEPDVWCNPMDSVEPVLKMIENYGLREQETVSKMKENLNGVVLGVKIISFKWGKEVIESGRGGGTSGGEHIMTVLANGEPYSDFTVKSEDENVCVAEKTDDGKIKITVTGNGATWINVTDGANFGKFEFFVEGYVPLEKKLSYGEISFRMTPTYVADHGFTEELSLKEHIITVLENGEPISDFTVESENEEMCVAEKTSDGKLKITVLKRGKCAITVIAGEKAGILYCRGI